MKIRSVDDRNNKQQHSVSCRVNVNDTEAAKSEIYFLNKLQTRFLIGLAFIVVGVSCQIYTQVGPDGYKYPKPQSKFNDEAIQTVEELVEEPVEEPAVSESALKSMQS